MKRVLVVANLTLFGDGLRAAVAQRLADGPMSFFVLVPAAHLDDVFDAAVSAYRGLLPSPHGTMLEARTRLDHMLESLRRDGAEAEGAVGDADPLVAIEHTLRDHSFDEIILSTLPPGASRWLRRDLVHRVERAVDVPVTHVQGPPGRRSGEMTPG